MQLCHVLQHKETPTVQLHGEGMYGAEGQIKTDEELSR